ncbi:MAG: transposase domain-containing protein [Eubacterium sp.]|nr:transposase domain-containing protein [Eubacterium sp.]
MSLIQTADLNGADPYYYLKYLMEELPKRKRQIIVPVSDAKLLL